MKVQKELQTIIYRIAASLDVARANYFLYCLIANNIDNLLKIIPKIGFLLKFTKHILCLKKAKNQSQVLVMLFLVLQNKKIA